MSASATVQKVKFGNTTVMDKECTGNQRPSSYFSMHFRCCHKRVNADDAIGSEVAMSTLSQIGSHPSNNQEGGSCVIVVRQQDVVVDTAVTEHAGVHSGPPAPK